MFTIDKPFLIPFPNRHSLSVELVIQIIVKLLKGTETEVSRFVLDSGSLIDWH